MQRCLSATQHKKKLLIWVPSVQSNNFLNLQQKFVTLEGREGTIGILLHMFPGITAKLSIGILVLATTVDGTAPLTMGTTDVSGFLTWPTH